MSESDETEARVGYACDNITPTLGWVETVMDALGRVEVVVIFPFATQEEY